MTQKQQEFLENKLNAKIIKVYNEPRDETFEIFQTRLLEDIANVKDTIPDNIISLIINQTKEDTLEMITDILDIEYIQALDWLVMRINMPIDFDMDDEEKEFLESLDL